MADGVWYALKISSGRELQIKNSLEIEFKTCNVDYLIINVLVPSSEIFALKGGKKIKKQHIFLPGYLFIEIKKLTGGVRECLRNTPGILGFLSNKSWGWNIEPQIMKKTDVDRILKVNSSDGLEIGASSFFAGDSVKVVDGPFKSLVGTVRAIFHDKQRLDLDVNIFDRSVSVELSYSQVKKI